MSYDEMLVSALLGVAVPSFFINDGNRDNAALPGAPGTFEEQGVVVDQVGCRFERVALMEWTMMVVQDAQNVPANGYGPPAGRKASLLDVWAPVYQVPHFPTYDEAAAAAKAPGGGAKYVEIEAGYLNVAVFRARYRLQAVTFLRSAPCAVPLGVVMHSAT
jgi:hypothetical protein